MNAPEDKRFGQIYERIATYMIYDTKAAYPKNDKEKVPITAFNKKLFPILKNAIIKSGIFKINITRPIEKLNK